MGVNMADFYHKTRHHPLLPMVQSSDMQKSETSVRHDCVDFNTKNAACHGLWFFFWLEEVDGLE